MVSLQAWHNPWLRVNKCITMKKSITLILILAAIFIGKETLSQRRSPNLNIGLQMAQPLGEFATNYKGLPVGFGCSFSMPIFRSPIEWGIGYAWNSMGSSDRDIVALINQERRLAKPPLDDIANIAQPRPARAQLDDNALKPCEVEFKLHRLQARSCGIRIRQT
jgi:hypothetical protein